MKYRDYKINAKKHLDACISILNSYSSNEVPENVLREVHYLSGYIIEGLCVYAIYKHYDWDEDKDIKEYDKDFTQETGLDYYKSGHRRDKNNNDEIIQTNAKYYITSHGFHQYVELLDVPFQGTNIPYIDVSCVEENINKALVLIDEWQPDLRYRYGYLNKHTKEEIKQLIDTCKIIYSQINLYI